jgi:hypothetical protein
MLPTREAIQSAALQQSTRGAAVAEGPTLVRRDNLAIELGFVETAAIAEMRPFSERWATILSETVEAGARTHWRRAGVLAEGAGSAQERAVSLPSSGVLLCSLVADEPRRVRRTESFGRLVRDLASFLPCTVGTSTLPQVPSSAGIPTGFGWDRGLPVRRFGDARPIN